MERIYNLDIENRRNIVQIISSGDSLPQKKKKLNRIKLEYIKKYCIDMDKKVKFTNGVVESVAFLQVHIIKSECIEIALDIFKLQNKEDGKVSVLDLLDLCLSREIIKKGENMYHYKREDLNRMLNKDEKSSVLYLDRNYLLDSKPTAVVLRSWCFVENLITSIDMSRPPRSCSYYERLLGFRVSIKRRVKKYVFLHARGKGFSNFDQDSIEPSFEFLKKQKFPSTLREYLAMNETYNSEGKNLIEVYNDGIDDSYCWLEKNILNIQRFPDGHPKFSPILLQNILRIHYPDILDKIKYKGGASDSTRLVYAIDMLGI